VNGLSAKWEGSPLDECSAEVGVNLTLSFEADANELDRSFINLTNDGTTVLHYSWRVSFLSSLSETKQPSKYLLVVTL